MLDRFRAAPPSRQIMLIAACAGAIGALLAGIWFLFLHTAYQPLFTNLRAADAAAIVADLERKKIPYELGNGGATILVPAEQVDSTRLGVMTDDLPIKGTVGFELFNKSDMGLTDFAQKINYQRALQGELARTIMTLDGVDTVRVHLSLGEDRIFRDDRVPPKASVTVRMQKGAVLSEDSARGMQRLVAAAVPNLEIANVVILDEKGDVVGTAPAEAEAGTPMAQQEHAVEQYYQARIRQALAHDYPGDVIGVAVWADLAAAQNGAALRGFSPEARTFPLQVTLSPRIPLDAASQEAVRVLVTGAIGLGAGDLIAFGAPSAAVAEPAIDNARRAGISRKANVLAAPVLADDAENWLLEVSLAMLLLVFVLAGFFLLLARLRGPRRLSERQRARFAERLRGAMSEGGGHVAST